MKKILIIGAWIIVCLFTNITVAHTYEIREVENGGRIQGKVTFSGTPPAPLWFDVEKNPEVCGEKRDLLKVDVSNGLLAGVVLVLEGMKAGKSFPTQTISGKLPGKGEFQYQGGSALGLRVKTKDCNFGPFTGVIAADETVQFENQDIIKHTLHTFMARDKKGIILRTVHNRDIQPQAVIDQTFDSDELKASHVVRIICNRHDFMQNWLYVVNHPYYAISDLEGRFTINEIPPGTYTLLAWHPILGEQRQEVRIPAGGALTPEFQFTEE